MPSKSHFVPQLSDRATRWRSAWRIAGLIHREIKPPNRTEASSRNSCSAILDGFTDYRFNCCRGVREEVKMGISVVLRSSCQEVLCRIDDDKNLLHELLIPETPSSMLGAVDWFGDTIFNRLQMDQFLSEWEMLKRRASTADEASLISEVEGLAMRCKNEPHLYLVFIGD
jgi:hypothetical protein